jgi:dipeptidyl-peptidase 4
MLLKRKMLFYLLLSFSFLFVLTSTTLAQKKKLTYDQVYQRAKPRLTKSLPRIQGWLDDNHYLESKKVSEKKDAKTKLFKINAKTGEEIIYIDYDAFEDKLPEGFSLRSSSVHTDDYTGFLFNKKDDLFYFSTVSSEFKRLTANAASEKNPKLSPDGKWVAFTRDKNLYALELDTGLERQLTDDGSDVVYNGWASWVYYEEILGRRSRYAAFWWSPNSEKIAFLRFDDSNVPEFPLYRADGVHGELEIARYPKPGDPNPDVKLGVVHLKESKTVWVDTDGDSKQYIAWPFWTPDSKKLFFQWMNRGQDNIKIYSANPENGRITEIYDEIQPAWVEWFESIHFLKESNGFIIRSDKDGWAHLYYYDMAGYLKAQLTKGDWSVSEISLVDEKNGVIYFRRTLGNSLETHLYQVNFKGKKLKRLTNIEGGHRCQVSPGGSYFIDTYSNIHQPSKIDLYSNDGKLIRNLGDSKSAFMDEYDLGKVELFSIPTGEGFDLPAIWVLPPDFDKSKKYPVLFRIYGGPGTVDVSNTFRRLSWHYLAQNGIIVMAVDHRGSGHFGKKGVARMHRNLGKWEMNDYIIAVEWLRKKPFIDPSKIGITGGSYGGYATCLALTAAADYFTHGIAASSLTDWKLYDTHYTERYMDTPEENPEGYDYGSVMTHAEKYKGTLLITHGTMDDNVHMQNIIQLISKFEDLNKDFELMLYPNARHGVGNPKRKHVSRESVQFWFKHFLGKELEID